MSQKKLLNTLPEKEKLKNTNTSQLKDKSFTTPNNLLKLNFNPTNTKPDTSKIPVPPINLEEPINLADNTNPESQADNTSTVDKLNTPPELPTNLDINPLEVNIELNKLTTTLNNLEDTNKLHTLLEDQVFKEVKLNTLVESNKDKPDTPLTPMLLEVQVSEVQESEVQELETKLKT